jgi:DNA/RNA-binding domain of Phe-tRNA-synthetase-like protein
MVGLEHAGANAFSLACLPQAGAEKTVLVTIDDALKKKCPRTALGCVTARVEARKTPPGLTGELHQRVQKILKLPYARGVLEVPQISSTRAAYKALGKDPARYRGSAEALLRRVIAGKGLPEINAVVDVINLVSVESRLPVGLYDIDHVHGDVVFRVGRAGESYPGIGKYDLNLEGLPVFCDAIGPHGSPTSDSERTMVTSETKLVLAVIVSFSGSELLDRWTQRIIELLQLHASGQACEAALVT